VNRLSQVLPPDLSVIQSEQPFIWPLAERLRATRFKNAKLIYSSHNIEHRLKADIIGSSSPLAGEIAAEIGNLERHASRAADISVAVTPADAAELENFGAERVVLAPNGVRAWNPSVEVVRAWRDRLPKHPFVLYVGSAHPPNYSGVREVFGNTLGSIPPNSRLVVAGSVGPHFRNELLKGPFGDLNQTRIQITGELSDHDLDAIKSLTTGFVLPISSGGGSNLKTAEAIYSGKFAIGTPVAFRSFEQYTHLPGIVVSSDSGAIHKALRSVLTEVHDRPPRVPVDDLLWSSTLRPMIEAAESLL
jgi:hypothetical protein